MSESPELQNAQTGRERRLMPKTRNIIVAAVAVQLVFVGLGLWYLFAVAGKGTGTNRLLVNEVLQPEELVFSDTEVGITIGERTPPIDLAKAVVSTPDVVQKGRTLFEQNCVSCHGDQGKGDGTAGATLDPRPRNLTQMTGWKRGTSLADIFTTVTLGLENTQMAAFDYPTPQERFDLTHYVMSLSGGHARTTSAMLDSLDKRFSLAEGQKQPNIIPLSMAVDKLAAEAVGVPAAPDSEQAVALAQAEPRGAELFSEVVSEREIDRVGYWLSTDSTWTDSPARLRALATAGVPTNGFLAQSELLSSDDWYSLHRYLVRRYRSE